MASFFVPLTAMAEDREITVGSEDIVLPIKDSTICDDGNCKHTIKGASDGQSKPVSIKVMSGKHTIILDGVNLDVSEEEGGTNAIELGWSADVTLVLKGESTLKSADNYAGIYVPPSAKLTIIEDETNGKLTVTGGKSGAGIGGQGSTDAGTIIINSGTINATGQGLAAGIGGGSMSGAGNITISGGIVTATGGNGDPSTYGAAGPGIGYGANGPKSGTVTITGGKVKAAGGNPNSVLKTQQAIACETLSSGNVSMNELEIDGALNISPTGLNEFNGIVKNTGTNQYEVYGEAVISDSNFKLGSEDSQLNINANNSLTINFVGEGSWHFPGRISGNGSIYNADKLNCSNISTGVKKYVPLNAGFVEITEGLVYTGADLTEEAIKIPDKKGTFTIAKEGWTCTYDLNGEQMEGIKNAGSYTVIFSNTKTKESFKKEPVIIGKKAITENMIAEIGDQTYTGSDIEPLKIIDHDIADENGNSYELVACKDGEEEKGADYKVTYTNNKEVTDEKGSAYATISELTNSNYSVSQKIVGKKYEFKILPAAFETKAKVTATLADNIYSGGEKGKPTVKVTLEGTEEPLSPNEYRIVSYSPEPRLNAGIYTVKVEAKSDSKNCTGTATGTFEILPKGLKAITAAGVNREYDGGTEVRITEVGLDGIVEKDEGKVSVDTSKVSGDIDEPGNAGSYKFVTLKNLALVGSEASNYTIEETQSNVALNPAVEIAKAKPPAPILEGVCKASDEIKDKFTYTLSIKNEAKGVKYVYWMDTGKEQESPVFDGLDPGSKHTFYAKAVESNNVEASNKGTTGEVTIDKLTQKAPGSFTLTFTENGDGTFTATIPTGENTEYSFDGINWSQANTKTDCLPNTTYTGYLRYAEIGDYGASPAVTSTQTTPKVAVAQPVISPEGGAFINEQTVSITTTTADAVIYYTTDGTVPTAKSKKYTEPFKIDETMTIKAIAVKGGMENSSVASADFELATGDMLQTKLTTKKGVVVSAELKKTKYSTKDKITAKLSRVLTANSGYNYLNIAYYDISIQMSVDGKKWKKATAENFPAEGLTITMSYPQGTAMDTHDFVAAHMYGETSERLGIKAGEIEEPIVTKTQEGLEFTVTGTSPVGIAWKAAAAGSANNNAGNNGNDSSNGNNNNSGNDGNSARDANAAGGNNSTNNNNGIGGGNGANGDGTTVNGENANGESAASESSEEKGLSSLLPQTGDMSSILPWVALAAISALILIILGVRKRRR